MSAKNTRPENQEETSGQPPAAAPAKQDGIKPAGKAGGFCVYLGPSIQGVIVTGTVFSGGKDATLAKISRILKDYPMVASLIVPGGALPESRMKAKTPGNLLYENYRRLAGAIKHKLGGTSDA